MKKVILLTLFCLTAGLGFVLYIAYYLKPQKNIYPQQVNIESQSIEIHTTISNPVTTLDDIFHPNPNKIATLSAKRLRTLVATGDVIPARSVNVKTLQAGNFIWPWEKVLGFFSTGDITFINLECPLLANCPPTDTGMIFCGDARHIEGLLAARVDVVSLANNHAGNYGFAGIEETVRLLRENNIEFTGIKGPVYKNVKGLTFAFLGYNEIGYKEESLAWADDEIIRQEVAEARLSADIVVVAYHWGVEYVTQPTPRQKELARLAIDSGADLIIGNHPHWIQPVEIYKDKVIVYAHGNFIFDQMWSQETREGIVGKYTFFDNQLVNIEFFPVQIDNYGQPHFLEGEHKQRILNKLEKESRTL
ncbi:MAG: CapA family protein [Patescibacteria group bacterium]|jgi:hypothetical protein